MIAGPTAGGKSALALAVAERDGGCVINADALQVYDCWRVLTARPDATACARAPHLLYGHVPGVARYSAGAWLRDLAAALTECASRGLRPVIVGGSGLYLTSMTEGLAPIPAVPPEIRRRSEALLRSGGLDRMVADLAREDVDTLARLDVRNPVRVQRAWEVLRATGSGLTAWRAEPSAPLVDPGSASLIHLAPDPERLRERIAARFHGMIENGALDECARFRASGLDPAGPSGRALGAAELLAHLEGRVSLEEAARAAVTATQRYAKRQRTWFRSRMSGWLRIDPEDGDALTAVPAG